MERSFLNHIFLVFCLLLVGPLSYAQDDKEKEILQEIDNGKQGVYQQKEGIEKLIEENSKVKEAHEKCSVRRDEGTLGKVGIGDCIWNNLDEATQKEVQDSLQQEASSKEGSGAKFEAFDNSNLSKAQSKSLRKVQDYLYERLQSILFDGGSDKAKVLQEHNVFHNLYESQIGRNMISVISEFCLDSKQVEGYRCDDNNNYTGVDVNIFVYEKAERNATREKNIKNLAESTGKSHFSACVEQVVEICGEEGSNYERFLDIREDKQCGSFAPDALRDTKNRACEIVKYIKSAKQALIQTNSINERWNELSNEGQGRSFAALNTAQANPEDGVNFDAVINISSNEISEKSGLKEESEAEAKALEVCKEDFEANKELCNKYFITEEEQYGILDEYELRKVAAAARVEEEINAENPDELVAYLKEEGVSDEEIQKVLGDEKALDELRKKITTRFENEKEALIQGIRDKLSSQTITKSDLEEESGAKINEKVDKVIEQTRSRGNEYAQLVHYTNVASSYLSLTRDGEDIGANTAALEAELADSIYNPETSGRRPSNKNAVNHSPNIELGAEHFDKLRENAAENSNSKVSKEDKNAGLDVQTINDTILRYFK